MQSPTGLYLIDVNLLGETLEQVRAGRERDLRPLLPQFVPYEDVRETITSLLE